MELYEIRSKPIAHIKPIEIPYMDHSSSNIFSILGPHMSHITSFGKGSLARSGAHVFTFAALISGLSSLYQLSSLLLSLNQKAYRDSRQSCVQMLTFS